MADMYPTVAAISAAVLLFLLFRQIVLWYWKINAIESLLIEIRDTLREQGIRRSI